MTARHLLGILPLLAVACGMPSAAGAEERPRPLTFADASAGKPLYLRECSACHGERGRGDGPAAPFVEPPPRDLQSGRFKLRTTLTGQPPATADVLRTIERGIPGTAMPPFAFLAEEERRQIAAYVLLLAGLLDEPEPVPLPDPGTGPPATTETVARGKQFYVDAGCVSCHGIDGKGAENLDLKDEEGRPVQARDFTQGVFRGGGEPVDIYYRFATGMDGSPMPSYGDLIEGSDMWALVDYVLSLQTTPPVAPLPKEPIAAGRVVAERYHCRGCHVLDDGRGGSVGPDLRLSGQKLHSEWVRTFLKAPREQGKVYPWRIHRMPHLDLSDEEVEVMTHYLAAMGGRAERAAAVPDPATFPQEKLAYGQLLFMVRCTECHNLGNVIPIPEVKQEGPDLINVARRVDYEWAETWILNPKEVDPKTRMTVPNITPEDVEAIRMFVWKTSIEAQRSGGASTLAPIQSVER
jgi:mono/diheme cytochrome c family protein